MGEVLASRADIARLYGRAAFGAKKANLDQLTGTPYADVVDALLAVPVGGTKPTNITLAESQSTTAPYVGQSAWLDRMVSTPHPLEERMVLFWHDHFATAYDQQEIRANLLVRQNILLRKHALGNFRNLVHDITIDAAMLLWLDGNLNAYRTTPDWVPNENYARELFELFTLGTFKRPDGSPSYTETDIREAARALTGWIVTNSLGTEAVRYESNNHDPREKTIFGETFQDLGANEYKKVVDLALAQPTAARFVAYKMVQNFAYQPQTTDFFTDPDPLVEEVAMALLNNNWEIRPAIKTLLMSDRFRSPTPEFRGVRQPIEVAIHAHKAAGINTVQSTSLINPLRAAGQLPFEPPNVGGWQLNESWLNRTGYLGYWWTTEVARNLYQAKQPLADLRTPHSTDIAATGGAAWAAMFGLASLAPTTVDALQYYLNHPDAGNENTKQWAIFLLIANSPEWQVM